MNCNNCNTVAPTDLHGLVMGRTPRPQIIRVAVRCQRSGCGGQLFIEPEVGSHVVAAVCILCGRTAATIATVDLVERYGITWQQVDAAAWNGATFLWHRIECAA